MKKKKQILWAIILLLGIALFFLTGCKPKQTITEKVVKVVDSTATMTLKTALDEKSKEVESLKADLKRTREENTRLQSEVSTKTTKYDTSKPIVPETGKPPISEETQTESKSVLEKEIKEIKDIKVSNEREMNVLATKNTNLEYEVKQLRSENNELKSKTVPQTGFNFRLAFWCFIIGFAIPTIYFLWDKIKSFRIWKK